MPKQTFKIDPRLDLTFERTVDVPRELIWKAWTTPKHIQKWFTPAPWKTIECEIDLRPGGVFYTIMQSPEGEKFPNTGCFLEVAKNERLVWTAALGPGYRPSKDVAVGAGLMFTAILTFEKSGKGTKYTATVIHKDEEDMKRHAAMGFQDGWGKAFDQLVALMKK